MVSLLYKFVFIPTSRLAQNDFLIKEYLLLLANPSINIQ